MTEDDIEELADDAGQFACGGEQICQVWRSGDDVPEVADLLAQQCSFWSGEPFLRVVGGGAGWQDAAGALQCSNQVQEFGLVSEHCQFCQDLVDALWATGADDGSADSVDGVAFVQQLLLESPRKELLDCGEGLFGDRDGCRRAARAQAVAKG